MSERKIFHLVHATARSNAMRAIAQAPDGWQAEVKPATRSSGQNERFHAICSDLARSQLPWAGKPRSGQQWKVLLVSGHAQATKEGNDDMVPGLEGEFVNLRESTALMSKKRGGSLIEYAQSFAIMNGIALRDPGPPNAQ